MFRKISLFLVLVLVIGALSACASAGLGTNRKLTDEKKEGIARAYFIYRHTLNLVKPGAGGKNVYLGEDDGFSYMYLYGFGYRAYKNGEFTEVDMEKREFLREVLGQRVEIPSELDAKKAEIEKRWLEVNLPRYEEHPEQHRPLWSSEESREGWVYFGSSNRYDIICARGGISPGVMESITIAEETFYSDFSFSLYGYKNGVIYDLKQLYEEGNISANAIKTISQLFSDHFSR